MEGSLARQLVCHPCTALSLGWTVWGVQADCERTFLGYSLVNLHLYKAAICWNSRFCYFPKQGAFFQLPTCRSASSLLADLCLALVQRGVYVCLCTHVPMLPLTRGWCNTGFRRSLMARNWPCLADLGTIGQKVILGYKEANMVRRDNRSDVADNAVLLALRLCWCSIPWHKVKVCPAPNEEAPHGRAATVRARPALLSPSCLPELLVPLCWEALVLVTWINFQMQTMAASANSWLSVAQDVPPHSSFPMPLSSAATSKGRGGSAKGALGVGLLCCADLVRLHYCSHITATFSTPKKPKRQVFGDYLLK